MALWMNMLALCKPLRKFWSWRAHSDWLCNSFARGYVTVTMYDVWLYFCGLYFIQVIEHGTRVYTAWCKHERQFGRVLCKPSPVARVYIHFRILSKCFRSRVCIRPCYTRAIFYFLIKLHLHWQCITKALQCLILHVKHNEELNTWFSNRQWS